MLEEKQIGDIFRRREAYLAGLHVVYASGLHGEEYINKDAILPYVKDTSALCAEMAERSRHLKPEVIVVPVVGAVVLGQWHAYHLSNLTGQEVLSVYADKVSEEATLKKDRTALMELVDRLTEIDRLGVDHDRLIGKNTAEELEAAVDALKSLVKSIRDQPKFVETFEIKRGYDKHVKGKRVIVTEDIFNTGGSVAKVIKATRENGGFVVGACALANRGGITANDLDVPELIALLNVKMDAWKEEEMPEYLKTRAIATHVGKGKQYLEDLARRSSSAS